MATTGSRFGLTCLLLLAGAAPSWGAETMVWGYCFYKEGGNGFVGTGVLRMTNVEHHKIKMETERMTYGCRSNVDKAVAESEYASGMQELKKTYVYQGVIQPPGLARPAAAPSMEGGLTVKSPSADDRAADAKAKQRQGELAAQTKKQERDRKALVEDDRKRETTARDEAEKRKAAFVAADEARLAACAAKGISKERCPGLGSRQ